MMGAASTEETDVVIDFEFDSSEVDFEESDDDVEGDGMESGEEISSATSKVEGFSYSVDGTDDCFSSTVDVDGLLSSNFVGSG